MDVNFDQSTIRLYFLLISFMFSQNFQKNKKINTHDINQTFKFQVFCNIKLCIKNKFMDQIVNNIQLAKNLTCVLRT